MARIQKEERFILTAPNRYGPSSSLSGLKSSRPLEILPLLSVQISDFRFGRIENGFHII